MESKEECHRGPLYTTKVFSSIWFPIAFLLLLILSYIGIGLYIIPRVLFGSGTDESIKYVAFSATMKRYATEEDYWEYHIDNFYYPPLYFLSFVPFDLNEKTFSEWSGRQMKLDEAFGFGGHRLYKVPEESHIPPEIDRLYRTAKYYSLFLGLVTILAIAASALLIFQPLLRWWIAFVAISVAALNPQFLYYSTLCNNDNLCNTLCALILLAFSGCMHALITHDTRKYVAWMLAMGMFVGLSLLAKTQALIFSFLLLYAAVGLLLVHGKPLCTRIYQTIFLLIALAAICLMSGGWWILYKASMGDWNSQLAHRLAHPWAFINQPLWELWGLHEVINYIVRSYFGLFLGVDNGIPDHAYLIYLLAIAITLTLGGLRVFWWLYVNVKRGLTEQSVVYLWYGLGLAGIVAINFAAILWGCREMRVSYGRLMFPTLVAQGLLVAWSWQSVILRAKRFYPMLCIGIVLPFAILFVDLVQDRVLPVSLQLQERLVLLANGFNWATGTSPSSMVGPIWKEEIRQPLRLPAGRIEAFRIQVRRSPLPQLGAAIEGELVLEGDEGRSVTLRCTSLGETDGVQRWLEIPLLEPHTLQQESFVTLVLRASKPWFAERKFFAFYSMAKAEDFPRVDPAIWGGTTLAGSLSITAKYTLEKTE